MIRDKYVGTKSNKFRRAPYVVDYLMQVLDCQEVRRLCRYLTLDPLADEAMDYDGNIVAQPDLVDSLEKRAIRDKVSRGTEDQLLFAEAFSGSIVADNKIMIMFIHMKYLSQNVLCIMVQVPWDLWYFMLI